MIDLAAYSDRELAFTTSGGYADVANGSTSWATPTAAAAAVDFADHFKSVHDNYVDDPGVLYSVMLLMGDRESESGTQLATRFDPLWGAGRMRMRKFDAAGMDYPWGYRLRKVCVGDGDNEDWPVNGGSALNGDVDVLKVVAWWYDERHHDSGALDDIDLKLLRNGVQVASSNSSSDNKERIYHTVTSGATYTVRLTGFDVSSDSSSSCGTDSMLVYMAYFYEDSDRDDGDGPALAYVRVE